MVVQINNYAEASTFLFLVENHYGWRPDTLTQGKLWCMDGSDHIYTKSISYVKRFHPEEKILQMPQDLHLIGIKMAKLNHDHLIGAEGFLLYILRVEYSRSNL